MKFDKSLLSGSTKLLILSVLQDSDKYGYEMIESLAQRSDNAFEMKEGTLYPLLHGMENEGLIRAYGQETPSGRRRRYYTLTDAGKRELSRQEQQWRVFAGAVNMVLAEG
ncbi:MAG: helix-turn-helix transcriptional regulator [Lachnospiraceae bacterium]|nr:helix-turn-helix transcriptional regulator [Lachnospiraceae bacterium]